jgi:flagellar hook-basal body complex protein FliE
MDKISSFDKITGSNLKGDFVDLKVSRHKHMSGIQTENNQNDKLSADFGTMFNKMLSDVNDMELKATDLANQMVVNPDSVNIHDVQIASEQAEMGILLTKGIIDRVIRAYREITNLR